MSTFADVALVQRTKVKGTLQVTDAGIAWESKSKMKEVRIKAADITKLEWVQHANQLNVYAKGGQAQRFDGFPASAADALAAFGQKIDRELVKIKVSTKGWNWGDFKIKGSMLDFGDTDGDSSFAMPLSSVKQSVIQGKNELALEFHQDDANDPDEQTLIEMRLYVPPHMGDDTHSAVEKFDATIRSKTDFGDDGDARPIIQFEDLLFMVPRGRYTLDLYATYFRMSGKSFNYKMMYDSVNRLLLLPAPNKIHKILAIELEPPIRQGRTSYPYLIVQFRDADEMDVNLNMEEDKIVEVFGDTLRNNMTGSKCNVASRAFRGLAKKKVIVPGVYLSQFDNKCVRCSLRANDGFLYILQKSFFFLKKPIISVKFSEIETVEFARVGHADAGRTFDFTVTTDGGVSHTFTGIARGEYDRMFQFVTQSQLKIANLESHKERMAREKSGRGAARPNYAEDDYDPYMKQLDSDDSGGDDGVESSEDEDYEASGGSSEGESSGEGSGSEGSDDSAGGDGGEKKHAGEKRKRKEKSKDKKAKKSKKTSIKKPMSAYMCFMKVKRPLFVVENPDAKFAEVSKELGAQWKALPDEDKAAFNDMATQDKERYEKEIAEAGPDAFADAKKKKKKDKKKKAAVKGAKSAWVLFSTAWKKEEKERNPDKSFADLAREAGERWKAMSEEEKAPYNDAAAKDKERHAADSAKYEEERAERKRLKKEKKEKDGGGPDGEDGDKKKKKKDKKKDKKKKKSKKKSKDSSAAAGGDDGDDDVAMAGGTDDDNKSSDGGDGASEGAAGGDGGDDAVKAEPVD